MMLSIEYMLVVIFFGVFILISLEQWYSKCSPWTSSISITGELVRNVNPYFGPTESETLGMGLRNLF